MIATTFGVPADFELADSIGFLTRFTPQRVERTDRLRVVTPLAPDWTPTELIVTQQGRRLTVESDRDLGPDAMRTNVERILSLDVDADGFADVVRRDRVLPSLIDPMRGIRPPLFWSPYEAAVWAVLSQRVTMVQGSRLKQRLADSAGDVSSDGVTASTPTPERLLSLTALDGANDIKVARLHAVARAALDGTLDPRRLRTVPSDVALATLRTIDGIGPFSAELILVRGAGAPDVFPAHEQRVHTIVRSLYGTNAPTAGSADIARTWAPYRSWVAFHLRAHHEQCRTRGATGGARAAAARTAPA